MTGGNANAVPKATLERLHPLAERPYIHFGGWFADDDQPIANLGVFIGLPEDIHATLEVSDFQMDDCDEEDVERLTKRWCTYAQEHCFLITYDEDVIREMDVDGNVIRLEESPLDEEEQ